MKNIIKYPIILSAGLMFALSGCSNFDEINTDQDKTTSVTPAMLCTGIQASAFKFSGDAVGYIGDAALPKYVAYAAENGSAATYNSLGTGGFGFYNNFPNIEKMAEAAAGTVYYECYVGAGAFMKAYMLFRMTMQMGDVPCSEAGLGKEGNYTPKYDTQESVFLAILDLLDEAETNFKAGSGRVFSGDIMYSGDTDKWLKATNALKLKVLIALSGKTSVSSLDVANRFRTIVAAGNLMENNGDNLQLNYAAANGRYHPLYTTNDRFASVTVVSAVIVDMLKNLDDHRLFYFAEPAANASTPDNDINSYVGVDVTKVNPDLITDLNSGDYSRLNTRYAALEASEPLVRLGYAEQCFNIAEAIERGWMTGNAKMYYDEGAKAALEFVKATNESYAHGGPITGAYITSYATGAAAYNTAGTPADRMEQIWAQVYIMTFMQDNVSAFYQYRRTGYPTLPVSAASSQNDDGFKDKLPLRWRYPSGEATTNGTNLTEAVNRQFGTMGDSNNARMWLLE